jgi:excisionase family DNA binding protein
MFNSDPPTVSTADVTKRRFTVQDVADSLGVTTRTVRNYIKDGDLPAIKPGREYIITRSDLAEFLGSEERVRDLFNLDEEA